MVGGAKSDRAVHIVWADKRERKREKAEKNGVHRVTADDLNSVGRWEKTGRNDQHASVKRTQATVAPETKKTKSKLSRKPFTTENFTDSGRNVHEEKSGRKVRKKIHEEMYKKNSHNPPALSNTAGHESKQKGCPLKQKARLRNQADKRLTIVGLGKELTIEGANNHRKEKQFFVSLGSRF